MSYICSIFNDVLGPVMRGPSSSHTAGSHRIGRILRDLVGATPDHARFEFHPGGSLATTYQTQGSDIGLAAGLLDIEMTDSRMPDSLKLAKESGLELEFVITEYPATHPNTYRCRITLGEQVVTATALSTGGGMMVFTEINGRQVQYLGDHLLEVESMGVKRIINPVMPVESWSGKPLPFTNAAELLRFKDLSVRSAAELAREYESARSGIPANHLDAMMLDLIRIWREAIATGLRGTTYANRLIGSQSPGFEAARKSNKLIEAGPLNRMIQYSTAIMETKSSMGVVIAAPTAGAAGGLPGCLIGMADHAGMGDDDLLKGFWSAGLVGLFIAMDATFAAEVAGCQAETGAGASMGAAGLVEMMGGNAWQALGAASMALQNVLGLICDPVANRVEIPCLGRNAQATANAVTSANMALGGIDPVIPLNEAIKTMLEVGKAMPHTLRCTALGGLSVTPTALALEEELNRKLKQL